MTAKQEPKLIAQAETQNWLDEAWFVPAGATIPKLHPHHTDFWAKHEAHLQGKTTPSIVIRRTEPCTTRQSKTYECDDVSGLHRLATIAKNQGSNRMLTEIFDTATSAGFRVNKE